MKIITLHSTTESSPEVDDAVIVERYLIQIYDAYSGRTNEWEVHLTSTQIIKMNEDGDLYSSGCERKFEFFGGCAEMQNSIKKEILKLPRFTGYRW